MELVIYLLILLSTGAFVGFASGLLGIGGGFIMVPVQFFLLTVMGADPDTALRVSFATSLTVILPTALSGALGHWRRGAVMVVPAILLGLAGLMGGVFGAGISSNTPAAILSFIFGLLALFSALWMLGSRYPEIKEKPSNSKESYLFWGFLGGFSSGLLGIGGGVVMVPILNLLLRFPIHKAIGTSTAFIVFASIGGILTYIFTGMNATGLPSYSLGYVNLLQFAALAGTSIPMARIGVKAAHRLPDKELKYVFAALLIYIALKMMGVFEWLNLPL
ncbi:sulfite exporter TauE/SafE family protein [Methanobacterium sp.]|uniref:sulfite exporter TauE/SafE family protein n=1 Tax=Methanobacterium sp. TaxID=2164 RepID=UPI0025D0E15F|nr:sulfite exporter TauE/SafE family protein [Methanobacterium sp.]MBI5459568.1 sulfite exporter TauE/SafE family protein [Methanobacterium sp.]